MLHSHSFLREEKNTVCIRFDGGNNATITQWRSLWCRSCSVLFKAIHHNHTIPPMTIVATEDSRNADWKNSSKGASLLKKMGWTEGQGLGRQKQGTAHALRAVKRSEETLGIGASSADLHGEAGWNDTSDNFASVLSKLQQHHGDSSSNSSDDDNNKKRKKKKKSKKKKELTLARNKVTAGHSKKMRESKCLKNKSEADMAAIFGTKVVTTSSSDDDKKKKSKKKKRLRDQSDGERIKKNKKSKKSNSSRS